MADNLDLWPLIWNFYEDPNGVHLVERNASNTATAKFLVFLIKAKSAPILVPVTK